MSMLHTVDASPSAVLRDLLLIAAVVVLAIIATVIVSGGAQALSFNITTDPLGSYPW